MDGLRRRSRSQGCLSHERLREEAHCVLCDIKSVSVREVRKLKRRGDGLRIHGDVKMHT
jgi:hypothetical protein